MNNGRVIAWRDAPTWPSLVDELRSRPGAWALVCESAPEAVAVAFIERYGLRGDSIEHRVQPVDDGPYGVLYDIEARYVDGAVDLAENSETP